MGRATPRQAFKRASGLPWGVRALLLQLQCLADEPADLVSLRLDRSEAAPELPGAARLVHNALGRVLINRDWSTTRLVDVRFTPRKRTCAVQLPMSALGHKQTFRLCDETVISSFAGTP